MRTALFEWMAASFFALLAVVLIVMTLTSSHESANALRLLGAVISAIVAAGFFVEARDIGSS